AALDTVGLAAPGAAIASGSASSASVSWNWTRSSMKQLIQGSIDRAGPPRTPGSPSAAAPSRRCTRPSARSEPTGQLQIEEPPRDIIGRWSNTALLTEIEIANRRSEIKQVVDATGERWPATPSVERVTRVEVESVPCTDVGRRQERAAILALLE